MAGENFPARFSQQLRGQTLQGGLNIPLLQCLSSFILIPYNSLLINHLIINLQAIAGSDCWTQCCTPIQKPPLVSSLSSNFQHVIQIAQR